MIPQFVENRQFAFGDGIGPPTPETEFTCYLRMHDSTLDLLPDLSATPEGATSIGEKIKALGPLKEAILQAITEDPLAKGIKLTPIIKRLEGASTRFSVTKAVEELCEQGLLNFTTKGNDAPRATKYYELGKGLTPAVVDHSLGALDLSKLVVKDALESKKPDMPIKEYLGSLKSPAREHRLHVLRSIHEHGKSCVGLELEALGGRSPKVSGYFTSLLKAGYLKRKKEKHGELPRQNWYSFASPDIKEQVEEFFRSTQPTCEDQAFSQEATTGSASQCAEQPKISSIEEEIPLQMNNDPSNAQPQNTQTDNEIAVEAPKRLPELPPLNPNWSTAAQERWLEMYDRIMRQSEK